MLVLDAILISVSEGFICMRRKGERRVGDWFQFEDFSFNYEGGNIYVVKQTREEGRKINTI